MIKSKQIAEGTFGREVLPQRIGIGLAVGHTGLIAAEEPSDNVRKCFQF